MYPQIYSNRKLVQGLLVYASRLKGELVRADRELRAKDVDRDGVLKCCRSLKTDQQNEVLLAED